MLTNRIETRIFGTYHERENIYTNLRGLVRHCIYLAAVSDREPDHTLSFMSQVTEKLCDVSNINEFSKNDVAVPYFFFYQPKLILSLVDRMIDHHSPGALIKKLFDHYDPVDMYKILANESVIDKQEDPKLCIHWLDNWKKQYLPHLHKIATSLE